MHIYLSVLTQSNNLNRLYLGHNKINEKAANLIAAILANNREIQELIIVTCCLNSHGAKSIMLSLKNVGTLKQLSLNSNFITDEAADDIADVVSRNKAMGYFSVGESKLQAKGLTTLLLSLKELKLLKKLSICSYNNIFEDITKYIIPIIIANPKLTGLDIAGVYLQVDNTTSIFSSLKLFFNLP